MSRVDTKKRGKYRINFVLYIYISIKYRWTLVSTVGDCIGCGRWGVVTKTSPS